MTDLNRANDFALSTAKGLFVRVSYSEAYAAWRRGEAVYERVLPDRSYTLAEKAQIRWTPVEATP